jgi:hypothetical protein
VCVSFGIRASIICLMLADNDERGWEETRCPNIEATSLPITLRSYWSASGMKVPPLPKEDSVCPPERTRRKAGAFTQVRAGKVSTGVQTPCGR